VEEKRIGIFGGVFDPVQAGHKALAETAAAALKLDSLYIIPCGTPPHKPGPVLSGADRLLLLRAVFRDDP
jgi:nicotinate-nucleotide adenylyltransferase